MIRVGLRFNHRDARLLRSLAARVQNGELHGQTLSGLQYAADAAETGEPLIIQCASPEEAEAMAARFILIGCHRPAVEELTGDRPAR